MQNDVQAKRMHISMLSRIILQGQIEGVYLLTLLMLDKLMSTGMENADGSPFMTAISQAMPGRSHYQTCCLTLIVCVSACSFYTVYLVYLIEYQKHLCWLEMLHVSVMSFYKT